MIQSAGEWHNRFSQQARWTKDIRQYLYQRIGSKQSMRALEVGCGTGAVLQDLVKYPHLELNGVDIQYDYLSYSQQNFPIANLVQGDAHHLPFATNSFNLVFCHFFLMWVRNPRTVIKEMKRLLRPGGVLIAFAEPDYGGRIDYPVEFEVIGSSQEVALINQGANPRIGRQLMALFHEVGLENVECGILGGQWYQHFSAEDWQLEWDVIRTDLYGMLDPQKLDYLEMLDLEAYQSGKRILYIPTFYASGLVSEVHS